MQGLDKLFRLKWNLQKLNFAPGQMVLGKSQSSMPYHVIDVLLEGLPVSVIELLRVILRRLLRAHVVNSPVQWR